jgi:hypothetical protein
MGRLRPVLATRCTPHRRLFRFSKQFLEGYSRKYECARLQGFEASGCLLGSHLAGSMYQAVLRQSSKGYSAGAKQLSAGPNALPLAALWYIDVVLTA